MLSMHLSKEANNILLIRNLSLALIYPQNLNCFIKGVRLFRVDCQLESYATIALLQKEKIGKISNNILNFNLFS